MDAGRFFEQEWPALAPRLARYLAGAGVPAADRDDLVQETALRVYRAWATVDQERSIEPFVRTVAMNAWRDQLRRHHEITTIDAVPEQVSRDASVEDVAVMRCEVRRVGQALKKLSHNQRALILTAASHGMDQAATPDSVRMARSRARRQLRAVLSAASGFAAFAVAAGRRVWRTKSHLAPAAAMAGAATLAAVSISIPSSHTPTVTQTVRPGAAGVGAAAVADSYRALGRQGVAVARTQLAASSRSTSAVTPAAVRKPAARRLRPTKVKVGPAEARVLFSVDAMGKGAKVYDRGRDQLPVCVVGVSSAGAVGANCTR